jgi:hypothetical protein
MFMGAPAQADNRATAAAEQEIADRTWNFMVYLAE